MTTTTITAEVVKGDDRIEFLPKHLGLMTCIHFESFVFTLAGRFSEDYGGGTWEFYELSNGGFFIHPVSEGAFHFVNEMNYADVTLSPQDFGITCCLYALSAMSFDERHRRTGDKFHQLREYALTLPGAPSIFAAID